jgi:hypothetical protein
VFTFWLPAGRSLHSFSTAFYFANPFRLLNAVTLHAEICRCLKRKENAGPSRPKRKGFPGFSDVRLPKTELRGFRAISSTAADLPKK